MAVGDGRPGRAVRAGLDRHPEAAVPSAIERGPAGGWIPAWGHLLSCRNTENQTTCAFRAHQVGSSPRPRAVLPHTTLDHHAG